MGALHTFLGPVYRDLVVCGYNSVPGGQRAMRQLLHSRIPFTAVLASNDESAIGAMDVLRDAGLLVPKDVAVIGFDDRRIPGTRPLLLAL